MNTRQATATVAVLFVTVDTCETIIDQNHNENGIHTCCLGIERESNAQLGQRSFGYIHLNVNLTGLNNIPYKYS